MKERGFTLIELLVVVAIIGILTSVVLASLGSARAKGNDAAIKGLMNSLRTQMEIDLDSVGGSYAADVVTGKCPADSTGCAYVHTGGVLCESKEQNILNSLADKANLTISQGFINNTKCNMSPASYVIVFPLRSDSTQFFCIDSTGNTTIISKAQKDNMSLTCL